MQRRRVVELLGVSLVAAGAGCLDQVGERMSSTERQGPTVLVAVVVSESVDDVEPIPSDHERLADVEVIQELLDDAVEDGTDKGSTESQRLTNEQVQQYESAMEPFEIHEPGDERPHGYYIEHEGVIVALFAEVLE